MKIHLIFSALILCFCLSSSVAERVNKDTRKPASGEFNCWAPLDEATGVVDAQDKIAKNLIEGCNRSRPFSVIPYTYVLNGKTLTTFIYCCSPNK